MVALLATQLSPAGAEVVECSPVPTEDAVMYDDWGASQVPPLQFEGCAEVCEHGLRKCVFRERPPSSSEDRYLALCNGRAVGPPCQMWGKMDKLEPRR